MGPEPVLQQQGERGPEPEPEQGLEPEPEAEPERQEQPPLGAALRVGEPNEPNTNTSSLENRSRASASSIVDKVASGQVHSMWEVLFQVHGRTRPRGSTYCSATEGATCISRCHAGYNLPWGQKRSIAHPVTGFFAAGAAG